ncbi:MAG TPA: ABC transporter ATP-binding protein [Candidatus Dormibacteraeota bacterium]
MTGVRLEGIWKLFGAEPAVEDLNLAVEAGEFMVLVGPSGCGKTTTLRMLAGLERPSFGRILIGDRLVNNVSPRYRDIAMVFQSYALYPHMNVYDNLAFGMRARGAAKAAIEGRVKEIAEILGLGQLLKRRPAELSGGQRQRVALGRALIRQPQVFLMDEPLSNLDASLRVQMRAELSRLHERFRVTTVYVTHDQIEAMTMGDRIAVMAEGKLQQVGAPEMIYEHPANQFVAGFIGSPKMNFIPGRLGADGARTTVEFLGVKTALDPGTVLDNTREDREVVVGLRPEDLTWRPAATPGSTVIFNATVDVVEPMGHEAYVTAVREGQLLISRFPPRSGVKTKEPVEVAFNPARLHLFDASTGEAILHRPAASDAEVIKPAAWSGDPAAGHPDSHPSPWAPGVPPPSEKQIRGGTG